MRLRRRVLVAVATALGVAVNAGALVAAVDRPRHAAVRFAPFDTISGGIRDLDTGTFLERPDEGDAGPGTLTVVPYAAGRRFRVPVLLVPEHGLPVVVTDVQLVRPEGSVVRQVGLVRSLRPYTLDGAQPFAPATLAVTPRPFDDELLVGIDVELCCATPPPGWVERLAGVRITYSKDGRTGTAYRPLSGQIVVVRA